MQANIHTLDNAATELTVTVNTESTDWNPWLQVEHKSTMMVLSEAFTIHLSGLSIEEASDFIDSWDEAGENLRLWLHGLMDVANEDVNS